MSISIIGDLNLSQMLIAPHFRNVLNLDYTFCPATTMSTFMQYRLLLPPGTKYVVIGCLGSLLSAVPLAPDVELSKINWYLEILRQV